ncbi:hypothetical protein POX_c04712 [Penicillium oxalicum]|uniref:hypothetical protein n=1 Tax=Penicillium oxalicum TaxID=69781 RepID=UPI0020B7DF5B|nr:hypothetical protein POX_c04712 [Penicillium oxalicum]KAI2791833.1 hypothetical protein POX_c04712 [Penicillium oxalicum]
MSPDCTGGRSHASNCLHVPYSGNHVLEFLTVLPGVTDKLTTSGFRLGRDARLKPGAYPYKICPLQTSPHFAERGALKLPSD